MLRNRTIGRYSSSRSNIAKSKISKGVSQGIGAARGDHSAGCGGDFGEGAGLGADYRQLGFNWD